MSVNKKPADANDNLPIQEENVLERLDSAQTDKVLRNSFKQLSLQWIQDSRVAKRFSDILDKADDNTFLTAHDKQLKLLAMDKPNLVINDHSQHLSLHDLNKVKDMTKQEAQDKLNQLLSDNEQQHR